MRCGDREHPSIHPIQACCRGRQVEPRLYYDNRRGRAFLLCPLCSEPYVSVDGRHSWTAAEVASAAEAVANGRRP